MPRSDYDVNINLKTKGDTSGTKSATKSTNLLTKALKAAAVAYGVLKAAQGAVNFLKLGNDIEAAEHQFKAFAGSTDRALKFLRAFNVGSKFTVDRFTAMTLAGNLLGMGLVTGTDEMTKMAAIATQLGETTKTAQQNMENFTLLLANQATRRLDSFKIGSAEARKRIDELKESGIGAEEAFKMTVLEMGTERLEKLGETAGLGKTKFQQLTATLKNTKDMMALAFSKFVNATGIIEILMMKVEELPALFNKAGKWIIDTSEKVSTTWIQMFGILKAGIAWLIEWVKSGFNAAKANVAFRESMERTASSLERNAAFFTDIKDAWKEYEKSIMAAADTTEIASGRIQEANITAAATAGVSAKKASFINWQMSQWKEKRKSLIAAGQTWAFINDQMALYQKGVLERADYIFKDVKDPSRAIIQGMPSNDPRYTIRPVQGGGGSSTTTTNSTVFNQTVNTQATQANVMNDFALASALAG